MKMYMFYVVAQPRYQEDVCYYLSGPLSLYEANQKKDEWIEANPDRDPLELQIVTRVVDVE